MEQQLRVFKPEVCVNYGRIRLPNLYVEYNFDYDFGDAEYDENGVNKFDKDEDTSIKYLTKLYGKDYLKQIICDAIDRGEIPVKIHISDTDNYDYDNVIKNEDNPHILSHEEFMEIKKKYYDNKKEKF